MSQTTAAMSCSCLPRIFVGKNGLSIELHRLANDDGQRLIDMYLAYQPRNSFQGLPPIKDEVCIRWVREMLATGIHVIAIHSTDASSAGGPTGEWSAGLRPARENAGETPALREEKQTIIGHTALFPVNDKKCEMLVVVCPGFQNLGIGTELVRSCIELADELGFERIWLPVDATNVRARHVYRKCGFEYVSNKQGRELDMTCDVRLRRMKTIRELHGPTPRVPMPRLRFPCLSPLVEEK
jgi:N-acetylglutamate synthase-like GNAT family acetyltransferase